MGRSHNTCTCTLLIKIRFVKSPLCDNACKAYRKLVKAYIIGFLTVVAYSTVQNSILMHMIIQANGNHYKQSKEVKSIGISTLYIMKRCTRWL